MKSVAKIIKIAVLLILIAVLAALIWERLPPGTPGADETPTDEPLSSPVLSESAPPDTERTDGTEPPNIITRTLNVSGDLVIHTGLIDEARQGDGSYDFAPIFGDVTPHVREADFAVCCIETTFAGGGMEYSGFPMFRAPDGLAASLKTVGFDLISTASNHCMDSFKGGLDRTLDVLEQNGLQHVGTYRSEAERNQNSGITVADIGGISVAFLSYTYWTNGIPVTGFEYAVNLIFKDYLTTLTDIDYERIDSDMAAARALDTDLIAVFMHWGNEDITSPNEYQQELADYLFLQGADLILGGHPHVPQPMELREVTDLEGNKKTGFLTYCLGNLISCQNDRFNKLTASVNITLLKNEDSGETWIGNASYVPLFMVDLGDHGVTGAPFRYRLWNISESIADYESGDNRGVINTALYERLLQARDDIHDVLGAEMDTGLAE